MSEGRSPLDCPCEGRHFTPCFTYDKPVAGEVVFGFARTDVYAREVHRCGLCGHFIEVHNFDQGALYAGEYVDVTYGGEEGMRRAFERIIALDDSRSDNAGRVRRLLEFCASHFSSGSFQDRSPTVLDVGSGLCVFLWRMKTAGWNCTAIDMDPRQTSHAEETVGVRAVCGDFQSIGAIGRFDLVTFNKVLEHVDDAVAMLAHAKAFLQPGGLVYVEVPDGEAAMSAGREREEFLLGHRHVFSSASLSLLAARANYCVLLLERLQEPSTKFTLRAFLTPVLGEM